MSEVRKDSNTYAFPRDFGAALKVFPIGPSLMPHEENEVRFYIRLLSKESLCIFTDSEHCMEISDRDFENSNHFNELALKHLGITPVTWDEDEWSQCVCVIHAVLKGWDGTPPVY